METRERHESFVKALSTRTLSVKNCQVMYYLWVEFRGSNHHRGASWQARQSPQAEHKQTSDRPAWQLWSSTLGMRMRMILTAFLAPSATPRTMMTKPGVSITKEQAGSASFTSSS